MVHLRGIGQSPIYHLDPVSPSVSLVTLQKLWLSVGALYPPPRLVVRINSIMCIKQLELC